MPTATRPWSCAAVVLFFVSRMVLSAADPVAPAAGTPSPEAELQLAVQALRQQAEALRVELQQREAQVRVLSESLAIARTESELFQRRWAEAQLRAQALGVGYADPDARQWQRQLIETIRSLYLAEAERQRLLEQLQQVIDAVAAGKDVSNAVAQAREAIQRTERLSEAAQRAERRSGTLEAARVLDVNRELRVVVLNVGAEQGARVGMPFVVLRNDRVIAELRVMEARPNICGALIETEDKELAVQAGDEVRVVGR